MNYKERFDRIVRSAGVLRSTDINIANVTLRFTNSDLDAIETIDQELKLYRMHAQNITCLIGIQGEKIQTLGEWINYQIINPAIGREKA